MAIAVVGLLLGSSLATAATVIKDGNVATGIEGLNIGQSTYNVAFVYDRAPDLYPEELWDFDSPASVERAVEAVVAVLNAEGDILEVGQSADDPNAQESFSVPYGIIQRSVQPPFGGAPLKVNFLEIWEGFTGDPAQPGVWVDGDFADFSLLNSPTMFAKFALVTSGGPGVSPPIADTGGPYLGRQGVAVTFDGSGSRDLDGEIVSWQWNFGDGRQASGETFQKTYTEGGIYVVTLTVTDNDGLTDSDTTLAEIGTFSVPPRADPGGPYVGVVGEPISMDGSNSSDTDGTVVSWEWEFGDNVIMNGPEVQHSYGTVGQYLVTLTVTDNLGATDVSYTTATVGIVTDNLPPNADPGGSYLGRTGGTVAFDGSASTDPDGTIAGYTWDFGDGSPPRKGRRVEYSYGQPDSYTVTLTVTDDEGAVNSAATTAVIVDDLPARGFADAEAVDDVNGNSSPDFVVLSLNTTDAVYAAHVMDGSTGNEIRRIDFGRVAPVAMDIVTLNNGAQAVAVLRKLDDGRTNVLVVDLATGSPVGDLYYGSDFDPVDLGDAGDIDNSGAPDIAVLGVNAASKVRIQVRDLSAGTNIQTIYQGTDATPLQLEVLPDVNGVDGPEIAVLAETLAEGRARVWVQELVTKTTLRKLNYGSNYAARMIAYAPDAAGAGEDGIGLLGVRSDGQNRLQVQAISNGAVISNRTWGSSFSPVDIDTVADTGSDGVADIAMLFATQDDTGTVSLTDTTTGAKLRNVAMPDILSPVALTISEDLDGGGAQEVAGLGNLDVTTRALDVRDAATGNSVILIDVP